MSNSLTDVMATLANAFTAGMAANLSTVGIVYGNGAAPTTPRSQNSSWVRWSFRPATRRVAALGRKLFRLYGLVDIQIFTPLQRGEGPGLTIAKTIQSFYADAPISGVFVRDSGFQNVGETGDGWYQHQLRVSFTADETL